MLSGTELARLFYAQHELDFQRAATTTPGATEAENGFAYSDDRFDDWLVAIGMLEAPARDYGDGPARGGTTDMRNKLRLRMNRMARKAEVTPRAFSVEARGKKWRVVLIEKYLSDRPTVLLKGMSTSLTNFDRHINLARQLVAECPYLDEPAKRLCLSQFQTAQSSTMIATQAVMMGMAGLHNPDPKAIDRLRRNIFGMMQRAAGLRPEKPTHRIARRRTATKK
jgi:hypothetical protein